MAEWNSQIMEGEDAQRVMEEGLDEYNRLYNAARREVENVLTGRYRQTGLRPAAERRSVSPGWYRQNRRSLTPSLFRFGRHSQRVPWRRGPTFGQSKRFWVTRTSTPRLGI